MFGSVAYKNVCFCACVLFDLGFSQSLFGSPELEGIACRSVHFQYPGPDSDFFTVKVKVTESHPGTYFCACGFNMGYFGMQELYDGKKVILFSVWDPGKQNDPNVVKEEYRVKLLYKDDAVRVKRFGNEGTGGQSFLDYDWKVGKVYQFAVSAKVNEAKNRTEFSSYFAPDGEPLKHLVTFDRPTKGENLKGYYSFVEDFRRNRKSTEQTRTAEFFDGYAQLPDDRWHTLDKARFTADGNPVLNINAGKRENGHFFLSTGGDIKNDGTPLWESIETSIDKQTDPIRPKQNRPNVPTDTTSATN